MMADSARWQAGDLQGWALGGCTHAPADDGKGTGRGALRGVPAYAVPALQMRELRRGSFRATPAMLIQVRSSSVACASGRRGWDTPLCALFVRHGPAPCHAQHSTGSAWYACAAPALQQPLKAGQLKRTIPLSVSAAACPPPSWCT